MFGGGRGERALRNLQQKPKTKKPVGVRNGDAGPGMTEFSRGRAAEDTELPRPRQGPGDHLLALCFTATHNS